MNFPDVLAASIVLILPFCFFTWVACKIAYFVFHPEKKAAKKKGLSKESGKDDEQ